MSREAPPVTLRIEDRVAWIAFQRPQARGAQEPAGWVLLADHVQRASDSHNARVIVLTGAGGAFCAGGDLKTMPARLDEPLDVRRRVLLEGARVTRLLHAAEKPTIAAIDGAATGAGLSVALACDLRLCSSRARLGMTFLRVGLASDFGGARALARLVGTARALELFYTGDIVDAGRALDMGLVNRVVPDADFETAIKAFAERIADGPPLAQAAVKRLVHDAWGHDLETALEAEADAQARAMKSADAREGVTAFLERRSPRFTGR